jgi:outer membrane receptor protein involved in Fe transport
MKHAPVRGPKPSLVFLLLAQGAWVPAAFAQERPEVPRPSEAADAEDEPLIFVTGSRIPQSNLTAVSPVTLVRGEEVRLQGAVLAEDLINSLPQAFGGQGSRIANSATGTATVDLRGLGSTRTLVLINNRRLLPGDPRLPAPDLNFVPTSLISRVEVLTGGASSVYGSDAVAGVVNFILDTNFEGVRADVQYSFAQHDNRGRSGLRSALDARNFGYPQGSVADGGAFNIDLAFGAGTGDGRGHVTAYVGYRHLDPILQGRRDYSACVAQSRLDRDGFDCGGSQVSANGSFITRAGLFQLAPDGTFVRGFTPYNFAPSNHYQRPDERYVAGLFADYEIGTAVEPYLEFMFMDDRTVAQIAPSGDFFGTSTINCDNPLLSAQQRAIVCAPGNLIRNENGAVAVFTDSTGQSYFRGRLYIGRRNVEGGGRQDDLQHSDFRLVGGVRGDFGRVWTYDAYFLFGRVKRAETYLRDFSITRLERALDVVGGPGGQPVCRSRLTGVDPDCVPWNVFAPNAVDAAALAYLQTPAFQRGSVEQQVANVSVTGLLGELGLHSPWAAEGVAINFGLEYRKDSLTFEPDVAFRTGDLAGQESVQPVRGAFDVREAFAETQIPLIEQGTVTLALSAGLRLSSYDDGLSRFSTDAYKIGIDFSPVGDLRLRASYQRAVRAPNVQELFSPQILSGGGYEDPCAGAQPTATAAQCALTGVTAAQYGNLEPSPLEVNNVFGGGNPALGPETATTRSVGVVLQPRWLPGFTTTVDWFDIDVKDTISVIVPSAVFLTCLGTGDPDFCRRIHRDQFGSLWIDGYVDATTTNIGSVRTRGVDVAITFSRALRDLGSFNLEFLGTWLDRLETDNGGLAVPFDCAGLYGGVCRRPRPSWRHKARLSWSGSDGIGLSLAWRHFAPVAIDRSSDQSVLAGPFSPGIARLRSQDYFDVTAIFRIASNYRLRLGVNNLFDREPPIVGSGPTNAQNGCVALCSGNSFPQIYDVLGRYIFAGVTLDL